MSKFKESFAEKFSYRTYEYKVALEYFKECKTILDIGCGQGTFIKHDPKRIIGIDVNNKSIEMCKSKGYEAKVGSALQIPYPDNSFDGVHCSHVIQIFDSEKAHTMLHEIRRVLKPNGILVLTSFPDHKRLFFTPETFRAYPPHAVRALIKQRSETLSDPTSENNPLMYQESIWLRKPALIEFEGPRSDKSAQIALAINLIQYKFLLRKYWDYNGYVMKIRNGEK